MHTMNVLNDKITCSDSHSAVWVFTVVDSFERRLNIDDYAIVLKTVNCRLSQEEL